MPTPAYSAKVVGHKHVRRGAKEERGERWETQGQSARSRMATSDGITRYPIRMRGLCYTMHLLTSCQPDGLLLVPSISIHARCSHVSIRCMRAINQQPRASKCAIVCAPIHAHILARSLLISPCCIVAFLFGGDNVAPHGRTETLSAHPKIFHFPMQVLGGKLETT